MTSIGTAQDRSRRGKASGIIIDSIEKSEQRAKNFLKDLLTLVDALAAEESVDNSDEADGEQKKMKNETPKRSDDDEDDFKRAVQMRAEGKLHEAEKILADLAHRCPQDLLVQLVWGGVLFNMNRYSEAIPAFREVLTERPANEPSSLGLFHCLWRIGQRREAIREMERFLSIAKSDEYEQLSKDFDRAIRVAEEES